MDVDQLTMHTEHLDGRTVIRLSGELDLVTQGDFRSTVIDLLIAGHVHIVLDLTELDFMDSTGLGAFIGVRRRAHALQGSLTLVSPRDTVMKLFTITGLEKVFDIRPSLEALPA